MKTKLLLLISLFFVSDLLAQIVFEKTYGDSPNEERTLSLIQYDNVVVLTGFTTLETNGGDDILLVKLDTLGNLIWKKTLGTDKNERANKIQLLSDGYLIAGYTKSIGAGSQDFYLLKTDFDGNIIWERTYGTPELEACVDVVATDDGGFLMLGSAINGTEQGEDWLLIKTDAAGNEEWSNYYGTPYFDEPLFIRTLADGNYFIHGLYNGYTKALKIGTAGNLIWDYGEWNASPLFFNSLAGDAIELSNGDILLFTRPLKLLRLNDQGEEIFDKSYWDLGLAANGPLKIQMIAADSALLLSQFSIIAINPGNGEELTEFGWSDPNQIVAYPNDLAIADDHYYTASDHYRFNFISENLEQNGIVMEKYDTDHQAVNFYRDTFLINYFYNEYIRKIVEMPSGDFLLFGLRKVRDSDIFNDKVLLTRTDVEGEVISEFELDKGIRAKPLDMLVTDAGNALLLTLINSDSIEISKVNTLGETEWAHILLGNFDPETTREYAIIKEYLDDQYILILFDQWFFVFDEMGNIELTFQNLVSVAGVSEDIEVLPSGRFLYIENNKLDFFDEEANWFGSITISSSEYGYVNLMDAHVISEDNIWLTAKTGVIGMDSIKYLLFQVNSDGVKTFESTLGSTTIQDQLTLKILSIEEDRVILYGNQEKDWPYEEYNNYKDNCLTKPLFTSILEEWDYSGNLLSRLELGVGEGIQLSNMIITTEGDFAGAGWKYANNSDDQYLVKIDRETFVPTTEPGFDKQNKLALFPNPAQKYLQLQLENISVESAQVSIFNSTGQLVQTEELRTQESVINVNKLPSGLYFLQTEINGKTLPTQRWIKM